MEAKTHVYEQQLREFQYIETQNRKNGKVQNSKILEYGIEVDLNSSSHNSFTPTQPSSTLNGEERANVQIGKK